MGVVDDPVFVGHVKTSCTPSTSGTDGISERQRETNGRARGTIIRQGRPYTQCLEAGTQRCRPRVFEFDRGAGATPATTAGECGHSTSARSWRRS